MNSVQQIEEDLLCIGCGYNLRHARVEGKCPECGAEVERSINGDQLYRADRQWLGKIALGMRLMVYAAVPLLAALIVSMFQLSYLFNDILGSVFLLLQAGGLWLVMSPEKRVSGRLILVRAVIVYFLISVGLEMAWSPGEALGWSWRRMAWVECGSEVGLVAMLMGNVSVFLRGREIACRSFAPSLRWQCLVLAAIQVAIAPAVIVQLYVIAGIYSGGGLRIPQ